MAMFGRLTLDKMGYSMPVDAPAYQAPPYHYRNAQAISIKFETDLEAALEALPARPLPSPARSETKKATRNSLYPDGGWLWFRLRVGRCRRDSDARAATARRHRTLRSHLSVAPWAGVAAALAQEADGDRRLGFAARGQSPQAERRPRTARPARTGPRRGAQRIAQAVRAAGPPIRRRSGRRATLRAARWVATGWCSAMREHTRPAARSGRRGPLRCWKGWRPRARRTAHTTKRQRSMYWARRCPPGLRRLPPAGVGP